MRKCNELVSVIIPAYNAEKYLQETLDSVLGQSYPSLEIIVINDGSTDRTEQIALRPGVKVVSQPNKGPSSARNRGIKIAKGKWIFFIDSDDLAHPNYIAELYRLAIGEKADLVFGNAKFLINGHLSNDTLWEKEQLEEKKIFECLLKGNFLIVNCLVRKKVFDQIGLFDESFRSAEDYDFWLRCAHKGCKFAFFKKALFIYRKREGSSSANQTAMYFWLIKLYKKWLMKVRNNVYRRIIIRKIWDCFKCLLKSAIKNNNA